MKLTVFESDFTSTKIPKSPYGDKTFDFETIECTLRESIDIMREKFILNRNYTFKKITRIRRSKTDLEKHLDDEAQYVIIDIDYVNSLYARKKIIYYFERMDYHIVLGTSRSNNDVDNFNMKGAMLIKGLNNRASIKSILNDIKTEIFRYGKIDLTAVGEAAFQAPTQTGVELLYQEGKYIPEARILEEKKAHIEMSGSGNHQKTIDICLEHYRQNGFEAVSIDKGKDLISFVHPSEQKSKGGYFMFTNNPFTMHHFNNSRTFNIWNDVKSSKPVQEYIEEYNSNKRAEYLKGCGFSNNAIVVNERYLSVSDKVKKFVEKWDNENGLLKIKSAMGTGKSNVIDFIIQNSIAKTKPVLLITNRISVARDFKKKYGIKLYSDGDYHIGDSLIVQFDSLWRFSLKDFDVVIMDEFMSLLLHSRNTMGEYSNLNKVKLQYGLKNKSVVIADAFLFGAEDNFETAKPKFSIINEYREDINLYKYPDINTIIQKIVQTAVQDKSLRKKVSVSCTSKIMAQTIEQFCIKAGLKTMMLSADSNEEDKKVIYDQFEKEGHNAWNVFIYTPTLTVGVSILNKCDNHFHIDESNSTDVISSLQMIRRSRKAKNIHFYLKEKRRFLITDVKIMNDEISNNIQRHYSKNKNSLLISIDEEGDFKLSDTGKFINLVEIVYNTLENNHKHSFELLLSHQIKSDIIHIEKAVKKININDMKNEIKEDEKQKLLKTLAVMEPVDYSLDILEEYQQRNYLSNDKDKLLKVMSEISLHLRSDVTQDQTADITKIEIESKFKFIQEIKRLKLFLTKSHLEIKGLLSYIVGEDIVNKSQINYFNYLTALKSKDIKLKERFTLKEMKEIDEKVSFGDFRSFCIKVGFKKRGGVYTLSREHTMYMRMLK